MTIVESTRPITGGVDTHWMCMSRRRSTRTAACWASSRSRRRRAVTASCRRGWPTFGTVVRVGVEGTGAYGAGLGTSSARSGPGGDRGRSSEPTGAASERQVRRARRDRSGTGGIVRSGGRDREVRRWRRRSDPRVVVARRSGRNVRIKYLNQIRHLGFTAPDELRERLRDVPTDQLAATAAALRPTIGSDTVVYATKLAIATLGRRIVALEADGRASRRCPRHAWCAAARRACSRSTASAPTPPRSCSSPLATTRIDCDNEAAFAHLCGVAPLPASSGKTTRHRLNPGGNRQANHALWRIVFTRMSRDERTRKYVARRLAEGRTTREIMRSPEALRRPRALPPPRARLTDQE